MEHLLTQAFLSSLLFGAVTAGVPLLFAAIKLVLQFALTLWTQHIGYSYFRDEFYYLACGRHLA